MPYKPDLHPTDKGFPRDFCDGLVWNADLKPWFNVNLVIKIKGTQSFECLMAPSVLELRKILSKQSGSLQIQSIDYVTPGKMNESGKWQMETLIEVSELMDPAGVVTVRCRVEGNRIYRDLTLEHKARWYSETVLYSKPDVASTEMPQSPPPVP